jgi:hypothetical protein
MASMGTLTVWLTADTKKFDKSLASARNSFTKFVSSMKMMVPAALSVAGITAFAKSVIDSAEQIAEGSRRIGTSAEEYQRLSFAARQTGIDIGTVENAMKKMFSTIEGAQGADKLAKIGLTLGDLAGKTSYQQFEIIASSIGQIGDASKRAALLIEFFGRSGMTLTEMAQNFHTLTEEAENYGLTSNEAALAADQFKDSMDALWVSITNFAANTGFIEFLKDSANWINEILNGAAKLNKELESGTVNRGGASIWNRIKDIYGMAEGEVLRREVTDEDLAKAKEDRSRRKVVKEAVEKSKESGTETVADIKARIQEKLNEAREKLKPLRDKADRLGEEIQESRDAAFERRLAGMGGTRRVDRTSSVIAAVQKGTVEALRLENTKGDSANPVAKNTAAIAKNTEKSNKILDKMEKKLNSDAPVDAFA